MLFGEANWNDKTINKNIPVFLINNKHTSNEDKTIKYQTTSEERTPNALVAFVDTTLMTRKKWQHREMNK